MQGLRLGTRGSPLALAQARKVAAAIETSQRWPDGWVQIVEITTTGDKVQDRPLAEIGGKALWTKELDRALLDGEVDFCVHSMKDVESVRPDGHPHRSGAPARRRPRPDRRRGIDRRAEAGRGRRHLLAAARGAASAASARPQDRAHSRQCRNAPEEGRRRRGRRDLARRGGPQAARDRAGTAIPTEIILPAPGQAVIAHGVPDQRHPNAKAC